jgi:hypothetical protein
MDGLAVTISRDDWHTLLTLAGAVAEALGVILVVFDLQGARRAAKDLLLISVGASPPTPYDVDDLSPEERRRAEAQARKNEFIMPLLTPTRVELETVEAQSVDTRAKMAATLTDALWRRWLAVGLLLAGIACGAVANLLSSP